MMEFDRHRKTAQPGFSLRRTLWAAVIPLLWAVACLGQSTTAPQDLRQTALGLEQQGRITESETAWRSYLKLYPASSDAYAHLGLLEARQGNYKKAIPLYRKALGLHSAIPGLRLDLGLAYFKAGDLNEALQEFVSLLKNEPSSSPDRLRLTILAGMSCYGLEKYGQAAQYLKEASASAPRNLPLLLALAHSYLWSKQYQDVMTTYHQILTLNAESAEADMLAGEALDAEHNTDEAIREFRAAEKASPKEPNVHFGLGYLLWERRHYQEAAQEFRLELANDPDHAQAMTYLADCDLRQGHPETAVPLLHKAIRLDPKIEVAYLDLGVIDDNAGRHADALRELKVAEKLSPKDANVHWRLGRLYKAMGDAQKAKVEFSQTRSIIQAADTALVNRLNPRSGKNHVSPSNSAGR